MPYNFEDVANEGICDVCGKQTNVAVCCSTFGAHSFAYCKDCLNLGLEPYKHMVEYIASAGEYPKDINSIYVDEIKHILGHLGKSEQQFAEDVKNSIMREFELMRSLKDDKA